MFYNTMASANNTKASAGNGPHGNRLLMALAEEGRIIFTTSDARRLARRAGIPESYTTNLLMLMVRNGWISRLRRGLYSRSGPVLSDVTVHPFAIATRLVTPSAVSHWSALHHHGLTEQIPRVVTAFTTRQVVTPGMRSPRIGRNGQKHAWIVDGVRYEFVTVRKEFYFGIEQIWVTEFSRVPITDRERTVLEAFISTRMLGGMGEALAIVHRHLDSLQLDKLVDYARRYGKISIAKRLGWALEQAGVEESVLYPLLSMRAAGYHLLDPSGPRRGNCDKRWKLHNNLLTTKGI